jgi:hypothetical protein
MDLFDDYQDEVERLSPEQIDAVLSGEDPSSRPLATLIQDVRVVLLEDPAPEIAARHLAAMAEAAETKRGWNAAPAPVTRSLRPSPRRRASALVLAAALLLVAGIAAAVTLPEKAAKPDQDTVPSVAPSLAPAPGDLSADTNHGQTVSDVARDSTLTGCEKGQAIAGVASAKAAEKRKNSSQENDPCSRAGSQGQQNSGRPDDIPAGPGAGSRGRSGSQAVGGSSEKGGPSLGPSGQGVGEDSDTGGAQGGGSDTGVAGGGEAGVGGPGEGGVGGGIPEDLPTP